MREVSNSRADAVCTILRETIAEPLLLSTITYLYVPGWSLSHATIARVEEYKVMSGVVCTIALRFLDDELIMT